MNACRSPRSGRTHVGVASSGNPERTSSGGIQTSGSVRSALTLLEAHPCVSSDRELHVPVLNLRASVASPTSPRTARCHLYRCVSTPPDGRKNRLRYLTPGKKRELRQNLSGSSRVPFNTSLTLASTAGPHQTTNQNLSQVMHSIPAELGALSTDRVRVSKRALPIIQRMEATKL